jgi:outer membrane protein OmpA-like peptidoglycan-associated protein
MGMIKIKTAIALVEQELARQKTTQLNAEITKSEDEYSRVAKDLQAVSEQVALMQKLSSSAAEKQRLQQQLGQEQQRAGAQDKVAAAELALKTADTVDAANYAKVEYQGASDLLDRARSELKSGNYAAAQTSADLAKTKAEQAATVAKPAFAEAGQTASNKARNEALGRDAAAIPGVTVRLERRGDLQRLVVPLKDLFSRKVTTLSPGADAMIDQVATLLKKYANYPVQVIGHSDSRGKHNELVALTQARAQSVYTALLSRGVDAKRLLVSGQGPDEPLADNKTATGRAQNNRVEVIFLFQ